MPPARDTNNRGLAGGRTTGLAAGAERGEVRVSAGSQQPGARASLEPGKWHRTGSGRDGDMCSKMKALC